MTTARLAKLVDLKAIQHESKDELLKETRGQSNEAESALVKIEEKTRFGTLVHVRKKHMKGNSLCIPPELARKLSRIQKEPLKQDATQELPVQTNCSCTIS